MAVKYLLECSCGEKIAVSASQAGQSVRCSCGQEHEVPTLLGLKKLETIEETPTKRSLMDVEGASNWGPVQGVIAAGILLSLLALGWLIYVMMTKPVLDEFISKASNKEIDEMTLLETIREWNGFLRHDIQLREITEHEYLEALKAYKVRFWIADILLAASMGLTVLTLVFSNRAERLKKQKKETENSTDSDTPPPENYH